MIKKFYEADTLSDRGGGYTKPKPYFVKYLPVEGEIKEGDNVLSNGKLHRVRELFVAKHNNQPCAYLDANYGLFDEIKRLKKVKLFLCSRDIQVGDKVASEQLLNLGVKEKTVTGISQWTHKKGATVVLDNDPNGGASSHYYFKVIGEISPDAKWVKEGDEFDEDEIEQDTELYGWNKEYNRQKDFKKFFDKSLSKKATHFEFVGETDYLDEHGTINLNFKVYLKVYKIKGACGYFH